MMTLEVASTDRLCIVRIIVWIAKQGRINKIKELSLTMKKSKCLKSHMTVKARSISQS